jgi:Flp pilus assembly protein TadB
MQLKRRMSIGMAMAATMVLRRSSNKRKKRRKVRVIWKVLTTNRKARAKIPVSLRTRRSSRRCKRWWQRPKRMLMMCCKQTLTSRRPSNPSQLIRVMMQCCRLIATS